jgi:hypothetical protein
MQTAVQGCKGRLCRDEKDILWQNDIIVVCLFKGVEINVEIFSDVNDYIWNKDNSPEHMLFPDVPQMNSRHSSYEWGRPSHSSGETLPY